MTSNSISPKNAIDRKLLVPGAYWVTGYELSTSRKRALIEIRSVKGVLLCNLHFCNTDDVDGFSDWPRIDQLTDEIQFYGPLVQTTGA